MATLPYWNNDEVISSNKLNSMVQAIINGDPLAVKVSNATKNDVNQIVGYLSSLHDKAKTNLNSATSTSAFDTAYANMTALVSNKLGSYANDDTVDLYSTGIRASVITFLQAYDTMMSNDRLNNKNTDNTIGRRIDSEANTRENADNAINTKISDMQANGGGRNLAVGTGAEYAMCGGIPTTTWQDGYAYLKLPANTTHQEILPQDPHNFFHTLTKGTTYTQTIWFETDAKLINSSGIQITWFTSAGHDTQPATLINLGENKYKLYSTYMWPGKSDNSVRLFDTWYLDYAFDLSTGTYFKFGKLMFEEGTVSHDWQPAPEDIDAKITVLNDKAMKDRGTVSAPDFNSLTQAGYYTITYISQGNNYPTSSWGTLEVSGQVADVNGRLNQRYVSDNGGTVYTRQYNNGAKVWTAWIKVATQNDIDSVKDLANSKANATDINWANVVANSSNTYNYASGSKITLPNNSSITVEDDRIIPHIYLPTYLTDYLPNTDLINLGTFGEYDNVFIPSATMATLGSRPTNPDTNAPLTGDCFFTNHYAYSGTTVRAFQKIYSCDYNYTFTRSYNSSSSSWTNWSCLTPYA